MRGGRADLLVLVWMPEVVGSQGCYFAELLHTWSLDKGEGVGFLTINDKDRIK